MVVEVRSLLHVPSNMIEVKQASQNQNFNFHQHDFGESIDYFVDASKL